MSFFKNLLKILLTDALRLGLLTFSFSFKVWHYSKPEPIEFQAEGELYEVLWRPVPLGIYPQPIISSAVPAASSAAKSAARM